MATGADAIGWRVEVFWEDEEQWFQGVITEYSASDGYYVCYDDGDEKWQPSAAPDAMRFLANTIAVDDASTELKGASPVAASHDYSEDGFDDKPEIPLQSLDDNNPWLECDEATPEPTPREASETSLPAKIAEAQRSAPVMAPLLRARPAPAKPVPYKPGSNAVFFKDREELQEMRAKLETTKAALTDELGKLKASLKAADVTSAQLKQTMSDLTAKLTVAQLHPATNLSNASSMDERMLELTTRNRQMTAENAELATTKREIQGRVDALRAKANALSTKWANVPQRHKITLVEVELEIALLLQHKSNLEATLATRKVPSKPTTTVDVDGHKAKLAAADARIWDLKRESLDWKQRFEQEQAKASALDARRVNLGAQLARFRSSKALLRRAFDRCDGNNDGTLTLDETAQVLRLLSPGDNGGEDIETSIRAYFDSADANHDNAVDFAEFCKAFEHLMTA